MDMLPYIYSTGRRKTSAARVFLKLGVGNIVVNKIYYKKYFFHYTLQELILLPFNIIGDEYLRKIDLYITVKGGGMYGQAISVQHGISRSLVKYKKSLRSILKPYGFITRDPRQVERKKYGLRKARRSPQFSKR